MLSDFKKSFNASGEIYLTIKAHPGMPKTVVKEIMKDEESEIIKIDVAAPAEKNKANEELIKFLAREFATDKSKVKIISGAGDRLKLVKIGK